jgi:hypothetical protein
MSNIVKSSDFCNFLNQVLIAVSKENAFVVLSDTILRNDFGAFRILSFINSKFSKNAGICSRENLILLFLQTFGFMILD